MENENYGEQMENEASVPAEEVTEEIVTEAEPAIPEETLEEVQEENTETEEIVPEEVEVPEEIVVEAPKKEKKPLKLWQMILAGIASALLLVALAVVLLYGLGFEIAPKKGDTDTPDETPAFVANNDYTANVDTFNKAADTVVATLGGKELTNKQLQVFFNIVVNDFVMNYYSYLSEVGLDYTQPLNEQKCYYDEAISWEEYFVDAAIETWTNYQAVALLAEEAGYKMSDDVKKALADLPAQLDEQAKEAGLEDADALLADRMNCTLAEYLDYWTLYQIGAGYTGQKPSAAELEAYFEKNKETYAASGVTKESGPIVDVRHILVTPEGGTTDESGNTTYSDKEWKDCKKAAEAILKEWKDGEATEDSFAALANAKSTDGGSNTNGGLYEDITADTSFVEPFLDWCMDEKNKKGDTGLVKTEFGYHIMYMSKTREYWAYTAEIDYINDKTTELIEQATGKWPAEIDKTKICLVEVSFA